MFSLSLLFLLCPMFLWGSTTWSGQAGGQFSVEAALSKTILSIDEYLEITLLFHYPNTYKINVNSLRLNLLKYAGLSEPPFAIVSESMTDIPNGKKVVFELEPQRDGIHFLSLYDITFDPKDPQQHPPVVIISGIFEIEITLPTIAKNFQGLPYPLLPLDIRYPVFLAQDNRYNLLTNPSLQQKENIQNQEIFKQKRLPLTQILGVFLFLFLLLVVRMQPKIERRPGIQPRKLALSSKKKAIRAIKYLEKKQLPQKSAFQEYYTDLSDTVRRYFEERYQLRILTKTTGEFLDAISKQPSIVSEDQALLSEFLSQSDKVKFGLYQPTTEECEKARSIAKAIIQR